MKRAGILGVAALLSILAILAVGSMWVARRSPSPNAPRGTIVARSAVEWYERGRELALGSKDLPGAIDAYREALALEPEMGVAHYGLGLALLESGDAVGAAAEIESALSIAPDDASWRKDAENALVLALLRKPKGEASTR